MFLLVDNVGYFVISPSIISVVIFPPLYLT